MKAFIFILVSITATFGYVYPNGPVNSSLSQSKLSLIFRDSVFLNIEGDLNEPDIIWGNVDVYLRALNRMEMGLFAVNERLVWDAKSGREVKISENIYNYVVDAWINMNKHLESGKYKLEREKGRYVIKPVTD